ncbi:TIGR03016 family PEP-CTERM system-associated outer membrane protein [Rhodospirillaceae bacterium SYSU D60014]|uniref:TIGR03016 family PEP-CTERM system-associated outer membrane protein n=1 Tax=Virgifigura deserti TaxID=2268457 RepID=UPI0013C4FCE2
MASGFDRVPTRIAFLSACASAVVVWMTAPAAWSAEVTVSNSASTSVTYTDNVDLDPDDEADEAIIWTNTGATSIRALGARSDVAVDAGLSLDTIFEDDTDVELRPDIRALGTFELLEERFFVDARGSASTELENPFSAISASPGSGRENETTVYTVGISPYLVQRFGNWATSELRYRHDRVYIEEDDLDNTITNAASLRTETGSRFNRLLLTNDLEYEDVNADDEEDDLTRETALLSGQYLLVREFSLLGTVGYEKIESDDLRDDIDGIVWNAGFLARPGPRTEFQFTYGRRYDQTDIAASALYLITPRLTFRANYAESLVIGATSVGTDDFGFIVDENGVIIDPRTGLPANLSEDLGLEDDTYLAERLQASLAGVYGRSDWVLLATHESRKFDFQSDETLITTSAQWNYALTESTRVGTYLAYRLAEVDSPASNDTDTALARIQLSHDLADNIATFAAYSRSQRWADNESSEYTENAVTLGLRVAF